MKDLAPSIFRQRLIIEGVSDRSIGDAELKSYLNALSKVLDMVALNEPVTNYSRFGWAAWIHWETSGAHVYVWDEPFIFISVDIYTCKKFQVIDAVTFTEKTFSLSQTSYKSV